VKERPCEDLIRPDVTPEDLLTPLVTRGSRSTHMVRAGNMMGHPGESVGDLSTGMTDLHENLPDESTDSHWSVVGPNGNSAAA
jgi:hypothetical protein